MTTELYKKHRPSTLARVIGNEGTVKSLENMLKRETVPHTLLFHGPSGCGKTTLARILKDELQCNDMDFKEMNCSDFRGIDTIRDIRSTMNLSPTGGKCRVWLLDEVHQLSKDAQNAALKMLEDTPAHIYFMLCTTDPQKLLKTIQTRCCEMPVRLLTYEELKKLIARTAKREKIALSDDIMDELITASQGSARSALVLLDKIGNLDESDRLEAIEQKLAEDNEAIELCRALLQRADWSKVSKILKGLKAEPEKVRYSVMGYATSVLLKKADPQAALVIDCFKENFYDSKRPGLVHACFEAIYGE